MKSLPLFLILGIVAALCVAWVEFQSTSATPQSIAPKVKAENEGTEGALAKKVEDVLKQNEKLLEELAKEKQASLCRIEFHIQFGHMISPAKKQPSQEVDQKDINENIEDISKLEEMIKAQKKALMQQRILVASKNGSFLYTAKEKLKTMETHLLVMEDELAKLQKLHKK